MKRLLLLLLCLGLSYGLESELAAQDVEFSQFYNAPAHLNPAMIGFSSYPRFVVNYRNQWPTFGNAYNTAAISYDQHFDGINSSVGLSILGDRAGDGIYNTYNINALYAYQLQLGSSLFIKAGFQAGVIQNSVNTDKIVYYDQVSPLTGPDNSLVTGEDPLAATSKLNFDLGVGLMAFTGTFYMGASFKHLNTPNVSLTGIDDPDNRIKLRSSFHLGNVFYFGNNRINKTPFYVTPNLMLVNQSQFFQVNLGSYFGKGALVGGLWYRHTLANSDAVIALLGVRAGIFKISYSYDFNVSSVKTSMQGHEIAFSIDLGKTYAADQRNRHKRSAECPEIFKP